MLGKLFGILMCVCHFAQCETDNASPIEYVYSGEPFSVWCNLTSHQDLSFGFSIRWFRDEDEWCFTAIGVKNSTSGECVSRSITINDVNNPIDTQDFQLPVPRAISTDSGNHSCTITPTSTGVLIHPNTFTIVNVSEKPPTTERTTASSETKGAPSTTLLPQTVIIGIGAGAGGGVLLIIIIIAVVCVKKKGKDNSTTGVNVKKANDRKSNPLDKNAENLHYADLTLHENPKSSTSKGTGSAKSKTLTVNPGDDRVEYAQVVKH